MLRQRRQAHPAHRRHRGWSLLEVTIVLFVIALAAAGVYGLANTTTTDVRARNMIGDIQAILTTVKSTAATLSTYNGLTSAVIIAGNRLDDRLIQGTNNIVIEGSAGNDYTVDLAAGSAAGANVAAENDRFFVMAIQNIEEIQDCIAIMSFEHPYLRGVLADAQAAGTAAAVPTANATNAWRNPSPTANRELIDRTTAAIQAACTTAFGANGLLTVHLGLR